MEVDALQLRILLLWEKYCALKFKHIHYCLESLVIEVVFGIYSNVFV